jgi:hypothetical protein
VNRDGTGVSRIEKQPPGIVVEEDKETGSRLKRAATLIKERTVNMGAASDKDKEKEEGAVVTGSTPDAADTATDGDGWVYGDNKWEATSGKGGLGKFTRYRRWTRIAILEETVEETYPGPLGIVREQMKDGQDEQDELKETQTVGQKTMALPKINLRSSQPGHELGGAESNSKSPIRTPTSPFKKQGGH